MKMSGVLLLMLMGAQGLAQDLAVGTRGGASFNDDANRFRQIEAFANVNLPWHWDFCSNWILTPQLDASLGDLGNPHADAFVGSCGPAIELKKNGLPLTLSGGCNATFLSRYRFGERDFGEPFQFVSHLDLNWNITEKFSLGWRFQHMSNAGIASHNPGLNLQMISISYQF